VFPLHADRDADRKIQSLCDSLSAAFPDSLSPARLAVIPFTDNTGKSQGAAVAGQMVVSLQKNRRFQLVDRADFQRAIMEIELSQSDIVDSSTALQIGKVLAAPFICIGSIAEIFGTSRITVKIIRVETTEVLAAASVTMVAAALDGLTKELLGERMQTSSALFRSVVVPGWGQFYSQNYTRGGLSLVLCGGAAGYLVYALVQTQNTRVDKQEWEDRYFAPVPDGIPAIEWWGPNDDGLYWQERQRRNDAYGDAHDRAVLAGVITASVWALNVVDAFVAGAQSKRKFEPYFTADLAGNIQMRLCLRF